MEKEHNDKSEFHRRIVRTTSMNSALPFHAYGAIAFLKVHRCLYKISAKRNQGMEFKERPNLADGYYKSMPVMNIGQRLCMKKLTGEDTFVDIRGDHFHLPHFTITLHSKKSYPSSTKLRILTSIRMVVTFRKSSSSFSISSTSRIVFKIFCETKHSNGRRPAKGDNRRGSPSPGSGEEQPHRPRVSLALLDPARLSLARSWRGRPLPIIACGQSLAIAEAWRLAGDWRRKKKKEERKEKEIK